MSPDVNATARVFAQALAHRGPDGEGRWVSSDRDVLLVHRRLAIIDLARTADQPMRTPDDRFVLVFNGEVFNYRELRQGLEARGEAFTTGSDTEVLLRLLALDGPDALDTVRGMFALALWDTIEGSILLARDRFGIKPLYVAPGAGAVAFASEIGALRAAGLTEGRVSPAGVLGFLAWGSVPSPLTWVRGVEALPPGTWWRWTLDGRELRGCFADARDAYRTDRLAAPSEADWLAQVGEAVRDSVRAHLVADVPVGVFLSGGIDSSALVSASRSLGVEQIDTFTIVFDDPLSEAADARLVSDAFGTRHHELRVDASHLLEDFPEMMARMDQPSIDGVNTFYVARAVAKTGFKAVLSGMGGDELFGGYPSFSRLPRAVRLTQALGRLWPPVGRAATRIVPAHLRTRWQQFTDTRGTLVDAYRIQRGFLMPDEIAALAGPALRDAFARTEAEERLEEAEAGMFGATGPESLTAGVARLESRQYLSSQLLRDTDAMSMAHALEVRVPFVDHVLLGHVWPTLGARPAWRTGKRLLWDTLQRKLPTPIVTKKKQGFTFPLATWMRGPLAPLVRDGLSRAAKSGWLDATAPDRVWADWEAGRAHWSRPWGLSVLGHAVSGLR